MSAREQFICIIPALNPPPALLPLARTLTGEYSCRLIVVNDGSTPEHQQTFDELGQMEHCTVLHHRNNRGKGRALKSAFEYILDKFPTAPGAVTADCDGQHRPEDILQCAAALTAENPHLILGVRKFDQSNVPWKSRFGNNLSAWMFRFLLRQNISDTQTGLRAIPRDFMKILLSIPGERFEFETLMLIESGNSSNGQTFPIQEIPIATVYEDGNRGTHFRPVADSLKISRIILKALLGKLLAFGCSGLLSAIVDQGIFAWLFYRILPALEVPPLILAVVLARAVSLTVNYLLNRNVVFKTARNNWLDGKTLLNYLGLCGLIMSCSYLLLKTVTLFIPGINVAVAKIVIDLLLFFASYHIQKNRIFSADDREITPEETA